MLTVLAEQEQGARSALAADVFDYYWSGAGDEVTRTEAEAAWSSFRLRPWPLRNVEAVDLRMQLFGDDTVLEVNRDVTEAKALINERKQFEHALRESEQRLDCVYRGVER